MKSKLLVLAGCIVAAMLLTGCLKSGSGSSSGSSSYTSGVSGDSGSGSGSGSGGGDLGGGGNVPLNPEPATIALVGTGLAAYMLMRRKKK